MNSRQDLRSEVLASLGLFLALVGGPPIPGLLHSAHARDPRPESQDSLGIGSGLRDLWGGWGDGANAVASSSTILTDDGGRSAPMPSRSAGRLESELGSGGTSVFAAGQLDTIPDSGDSRWTNISGRTGGPWVNEYATSEGLVDNGVYAIAIDRMGHKWFGTESGVSEFDGSTWTTYTTADGLADNWVRAIAIDDAGHKWFGTSGGVSEFDGSTWTTYRHSEHLPSNDVTAIAVEGAGHTWFGSEGGVSELDGSAWTTYTTWDGLVYNWVHAIAIDGAGHKWFSTGRGLSEFDGSTWTTFTTEDGLAHNDVTVIAIDEAGRMWFGTFGGGVSELPPHQINLPLVLSIPAGTRAPAGSGYPRTLVWSPSFLAACCSS